MTTECPPHIILFERKAISEQSTDFSLCLENGFNSCERRTCMAKTIKWEKDFDRVLTLARAGKKMVLLDFFNPL
jgi:hypothetical protein